ncbi:hypothetical protein [uncultured Methanobrevibacter sp.]|uniref:hypothetical protein n=1 Tax=uncultured Methanobrevibacter sp. TaxID=253161 RepID=UPI0025D03AA0|nr:hypothetical protein [uncultured Methanobrevibacter sp.]
MSDTNFIGNGSSIFKTIGLIIAGYLIPLAVAQGVNFHGQETQITQLFGIIIAIALSYIDMKYMNTFFKRNEITIEDYINYGIKHFNLQTAEVYCDCEDCKDCKSDENPETLNGGDNDI